MSELTNFEKIRKLRWQLAGNAFNTISCATNFYGGSMFILFLNELNLDTARIGFLLSLLPFWGITSLFTAHYIARIGYKRTFVGYTVIRLIFVAMLLLTPFILRIFGPSAAFMTVASATACFSLAKAFGETAMTAWQQELIPDMIRGKFAALTAIIQLTVNAATIFIGGWIIGLMNGLTPYMILISAGLVVGVLSAWCYSFMPGGAPIASYHGNMAHFKQMYDALVKDRNYFKYILGMTLVFIGFCVATTFVPLFMKNEVGLSAKVVIWLDIASFLGGIASSYLWGWAADRYGSKPVMLMGPLTMMLFPFICFVMPRGSPISVIPAMMVPFIYGAAGMAWNLGLGRYLYVTAMPSEKKTPYTAVYYAGLNLAAAIGIASSGILLKLTSNIRGSVLGFPIDPYLPIFAIGMIITLAGMGVISTLQRGADMPTLEFVSMFIKGNPLSAFRALFRYRYAKHEHARIRVLYHLACSRSPLNDREIIESLQDPSLNVCLEAITVIAMRKTKPELVNALEPLLRCHRSPLRVAAARALGQMAAKTSIPILREILGSNDSTLRCAVARSLSLLGDTESIESIAQLLNQENDLDAQVTYAYALGRLKARQYTTDLLHVLANCKNADLRREATLAVAMLEGDEMDYITLWRQLHADYTTGAAQVLWSVRRSAEKKGLSSTIINLLETAATTFAQNEISQALVHLKNLLTILQPLCDDSVISEILTYCISRINTINSDEREYILLTIHTLNQILINCRIKAIESERSKT